MSESFIRLYNESQEPAEAFFLESGKVFFYPNTVDKYAINGRKLIFGVTEILMSSLGNTPASRIETAITTAESSIKRMPVEKVLQGMESFSFVLNVCMVIARQVLLTNQIINRNLNTLEGDEKKTRELSIEYYLIMERLREEFNKRKFPWLAAIVKEFELNLTCKKGEAYYRSSEPVRITETHNLSDKMIEFERGALICEENTTGEEMYILQSGTIEVLIDGNSVATIEEPGTVSGEMALLLGEKRSATLKAKNGVILTKITKADLKEAAAKQEGLMKGIALSLAKRHYFNVMKIRHISEQAMEEAVDTEASGTSRVAASRQAGKELASLKNRINEETAGKDVSFMQDLMDKIV